VNRRRREEYELQVDNEARDDGKQNVLITKRTKKKLIKTIKTNVVHTLIETVGINDGQNLSEWTNIIKEILIKHDHLLAIHMTGTEDGDKKLTNILLESTFSERGIYQQIEIAMKLNLIPYLSQSLTKLTTKYHENIVKSDRSYNLFFKALLQNKIECVRLG